MINFPLIFLILEKNLKREYISICIIIIKQAAINTSSQVNKFIYIYCERNSRVCLNLISYK